MITAHAYPRAALIGNPSDGYHGKTIAFVFSNFKASVWLQESKHIEIVPHERDLKKFNSLEDLHQDMSQYGYYGGLRILKAALKRFYEHMQKHGATQRAENFKLSYDSDVPHRLGLAGSSAIITATMRALMQFYEVHIPPAELANLVLSVEMDELGIGAGLQDRVAQAYEQPVYMDFSQEHFDKQGYGNYIPFSKSLLPNLFIAYRTNMSEGSEVVHNTLRERYRLGDPQVLEAIGQWAQYSEDFFEGLATHNLPLLNQLINNNFDLRRRVMGVHSANLEMVEVARNCGASAKFTGSGGAIIGMYTDEVMLDQLKENLASIGVEIIKPTIVGSY
jgi:glucuronokinase